MKAELLQKVLACPTLPSLPAVALRVIELTGDPNVKMSELAATIQNDQGLAAKILKTVNSSFYGLRQPCATINKALVMLGLAPVKTLALGFSLVSSMESKSDSSFDYVSYWRRGLYTAVAAKALAEAAKKPWGDEAFLAGLLQDLGVMALYRALGGEYVEVLEKTRGDHRQLVKHELADLEVQHPEVGAMLAERWKLPAELVMPVRYHERPTAAPGDHAELIRCVGLGNYVHDALTNPDPGSEMRRVYERGEQWLGLDAAAIDASLKRVAEGVKELSRLFSLDTGAAANTDEVLARAAAQREKLESQAGSASDDGMGSLLQGASDVDALTGVANRSKFDGALRSLVTTTAGKGSVALAHVRLDRFQECCQTSGLEAGDEFAIRVATLLTNHFTPVGATVFRLKPDVFAAAGPEQAAGAYRQALDAFWREFAGGGKSGAPGTLSAGLAVLQTANPVELVTAAGTALQEAVKAGGNRYEERGAAKA